MRQIIQVRASSLSEVFDCPARWAAKYIDNIKMPTNGRALLGMAVHASAALYDSSALANEGITVEEAKGVAVDKIRDSTEVIWDEEQSVVDIERIALMLHDKYCYHVAPTQKYIAVEIKCDSLLIDDLGLELTGTADRIYQDENGDYGIADLKTGKSVVKTDNSVDTKGHAYQLGVYELLAEQASGIKLNAPAKIIGMNTAKTDAGQRIGIGRIEETRDVLLGDEDSPGVLKIAADLIHGGNFFGNPKSMLCHKNYCPIYNNCKFRK